ncbi:MAG: 3'-5' exonuclease [Kiritimatiellae bacterium]|nr:3'-5' exonuclease [Kiritimatiellia bacterium]
MFPLRLERALVVFDIEATGTDPGSDRIIDLAVIRLEPDGSRSAREFRFHPGIPIPPAATAVHGIRDEDVRNCPPFEQRAEEVERWFRDADLAGFNIARFDVPLLRAEFRRANRQFSLEGRRLVDAQRIFHMKEPRTLSAAARFYVGVEHVGAHGALADAEMTLRVLERQIERYEDLPREVPALSEWCFPTNTDAADLEGKLRWTPEGELVLTFGRFKGRTLRELANDSSGPGRDYLKWMLRQEFAPDVRAWVQDALEGRAPRRTPP